MTPNTKSAPVAERQTRPGLYPKVDSTLAAGDAGSSPAGGTIRYRDVIERELYRARQVRDANRRKAEGDALLSATASDGAAAEKLKESALLCAQAAEWKSKKIAELEAELTSAPARPRENAASFRRRIGPLDSLGIHYRTDIPTPAEIASIGDQLDIPSFLRRAS